MVKVKCILIIVNTLIQTGILKLFPTIFLMNSEKLYFIMAISYVQLSPCSLAQLSYKRAILTRDLILIYNNQIRSN